MDLGASTTKLALCRGGEIVETAAIALGTRSLALDGADHILELRPAAARSAEDVGVSLRTGAPLDDAGRQKLASRLVDCIFALIERRPLDALARSLMLTAPLSDPSPLDQVSFTGGGAECLYGRAERSFGDLGFHIGRSVREHVGQLGSLLFEPDFPSWATVLGGIQYRLQDGEPVYDEPAAFAGARARDREFLSVPEREAVTSS